MLTVGAMWGLHGPLLKLAYRAGLNFALVSVGEYAIATLAFGLACWVGRVPWPREDRGFWLRMLLGGLVGSGKFRPRETVAAGLASATAAFFGLLKGQNFGKQVVQI